MIAAEAVTVRPTRYRQMGYSEGIFMCLKYVVD
jgi:hypothetical protein